MPLVPLYRFHEMSGPEAQEIAGWEYEPPYSLYNFNNRPGIVEELLAGNYYSVVDQTGELTGYFCLAENARVRKGTELGLYGDGELLDIGLGMRPALTGQGHGSAFFKACLQFAAQIRPTRGFRLTVAAFNRRAIRTYEKAGFAEVAAFTQPVRGSELAFIVMELSSAAF